MGVLALLPGVSRLQAGLLASVLFAGAVALSYAFLGDGQSGSAATSDLQVSPIEYDIERDPDVPKLPFDDNPDPDQCGIPVQWGPNDNEGWLTGLWEGDLIQPEVLVYNSHLRVSVTGSAPHGTQVEIVMYQENPVLNYYFVRIPGQPGQEGWVPAPFLSLEPVEPLDS